MGSLERLEGLLGGLNLFKPTKGGAVIEGVNEYEYMTVGTNM